MDYKITKDDFYIVSVAIYDDIYKGELIPRLINRGYHK